MASRRTFLASLGTGGLLVACSHPSHPEAPHGNEEEVTPAEDLMREHGILRRAVYLYDEAAMRLDKGADVPLDALGSAAALIRRVIEDYHEKLEEEFLFPRFEKAGRLVDLVATLRTQHEVGRALTDQISTLAKATRADPDRGTLARTLRTFNHMYRPHASREDTVLFPQLRALVGSHEYAELGEQFEDRETQMLGEHGFERAVDEVATLEKAFGVADLASLTPA